MFLRQRQEIQEVPRGVIRPLPGALCSVLLLILSFPPFDLGWLAWIALVPWLMCLDQRAPGQAFWLSYAVGFIFFAGTMGWILYVTIPGFILLVAYLALYFGAWGYAAHRLAGPGKWQGLFLLPAAWVALEHLRSHLLTGLGWNLLAHTQWNWMEIIQLADLTGVTGVSFLIVIVNVSLWQRLRRSMGRVFLAGICFFAALAYGAQRLQQIDSSQVEAQVPSLKVALLQGNIPQYEKWDEAFQTAIWNRYEALTREAAQSDPDLIIWPETAVPGYLEDKKIGGRLVRLIGEVHTPLLTGVPVSDETGERVFNSAILFDSQGSLLNRYDKIHRVPFGEYVPLGKALAWLRNFILMGDFSPGRRLTVFQSPTRNSQSTIPFSVLICFEDLFPDLCRRFIQQGARGLVVITNDAWFLRSAASLQHAQASVFRAIEGRVWVARAANTGWSGFIDPAGRRRPIPEQVPRFEPGFAVSRVHATLNSSAYIRWGDWFPILCLILVGGAFLPSRRPV